MYVGTNFKNDNTVEIKTIKIELIKKNFDFKKSFNNPYFDNSSSILYSIFNQNNYSDVMILYIDFGNYLS